MNCGFIFFVVGLYFAVFVLVVNYDADLHILEEPHNNISLIL